jgi:hypothetical protein
MRLNLEFLPIQSRRFRLYASLFIGFVGQVPFWVIGTLVELACNPFFPRLYWLAYVAAAPLAPGAYLAYWATKTYNLALEDPRALLLGYLVNGFIYTEAFFAAMTLWSRRRSRRTLGSKASRGS